MAELVNPQTNRRIKFGSAAHIKLAEAGLVPPIVGIEKKEPEIVKEAIEEVSVLENGAKKMTATIAGELGITINVGAYTITIKKTPQ